MNPNEQLPEDPSPRTITLRLTRDTLILIAAMLFLAIAIVLAVLFPQGSGRPSPVASAPTAGTPQSTGSVPLATAIVVPRATETPADGAVAEQPTAYPAPAGEPAGAAPTTTAEPPRPTEAPGTLPLPTDAATAPLPTASAGEATAYPAPGDAAQPAGTASTTAVAFPTTAAPPTPVVLPTIAQPTVAQPTIVQPTDTPPAAAAPTLAPPQAASSDPPPPTARPAPPVDVIKGTTYWTSARSPIVVSRSMQIPAGAGLIIEPGTEVRLAPGVSIFVDGQLLALGQPGRPARIVSASGPRWEGIFGRPGSSIVLENTDVSGGGAGGTLIATDGGALALRGAHLHDNGGHIRASGNIEVRSTEISGNDMPYGAPVDVTLAAGGSITLVGNRIGGNRMAAGSAPVQITSQSPFDTVNLDIQGNLFVGQEGPNLTLITNGPMQGNIICNALVGGLNGLSIRGSLPQVPGLPALLVRDNAIERHTPPILPIYLDFGIGRGATSEVALDMRQNWWESDTGPYEPDRHADGRGEAVGDNIEFAPWSTVRPACAPTQ